MLNINQLHSHFLQIQFYQTIASILNFEIKNYYQYILQKLNNYQNCVLQTAQIKLQARKDFLIISKPAEIWWGKHFWEATREVRFFFFIPLFN